MCNSSYLFDTLPEVVVPMPVYYEPQITPPLPRTHQCDSRKTSTNLEMQPKVCFTLMNFEPLQTNSFLSILKKVFN